MARLSSIFLRRLRRPMWVSFSPPSPPHLSSHRQAGRAALLHAVSSSLGWSVSHWRGAAYSAESSLKTPQELDQTLLPRLPTHLPKFPPPMPPTLPPLPPPPTRPPPT